jgi:hypothetical protein
VNFGWEFTKKLSGLSPDFYHQKFSPHCAIGAVAAGAKSQPSAIALAWHSSQGKLYCGEINLGPSIAND